MSFNYLIAINKPINWTSSDVVIKVRNILSKATNQKMKIGHMGTLDPLATGVLLLGVNKAARLFDVLLQKDKEYLGTLKFGSSTDTQDSLGKVISTSTLPTLDSIKNALPNFIGDINQIPPKYSALSINGVKAYDLARKGKDFEIAQRNVKINNLTLVNYIGQEKAVESVKLDVECSSGTYIRTLFYDIAKSISVDGHMSALDRIKVANINKDKCVDMDTFLKEPLEHFIDPLFVLKSIMDEYELNDKEFYDVQRGVGIEINTNNDMLAMTYNGEIKFVAKKDGNLFKSQVNLE